jgi:hypothetical protein
VEDLEALEADLKRFEMDPQSYKEIKKIAKID